MSFIITVTETKEVQVKQKDWLKVADTGNKKGDGPVYEYVFSDGTKVEEKEVYRQEVDSVDLVKIINAVNTIPETPAEEKAKEE